MFSVGYYDTIHASFVSHRKVHMPKLPGFKTETQRERFVSAASLYARGGPLARVCGAKLRNGKTCPQLALSGEARCLRHGGPDAAHRFRERQKRGLEAGSVSPDVWARAEAKRAKNSLEWVWRQKPNLPGRTIDLGADEGVFQDAVLALGVDLGSLYPAQADWLRWRYQRTQRDRTADAAWVRAVQVDLPRQIARAEAAMVWVRLGGLDKRTKEGRALKAALRAGGEEQAAALALTLTLPLHKPPQGAFTPALKVWTAPPVPEPSKRGQPDRIKRPNPARGAALKPLGRPKVKPDTEDELTALMAAYSAAGPTVRAMFEALLAEQDRLAFLRALKALVDAPDDPSAHRRWAGWVQRLRGVA